MLRTTVILGVVLCLGCALAAPVNPDAVVPELTENAVEEVAPKLVQFPSYDEVLVEQSGDSILNAHLASGSAASFGGHHAGPCDHIDPNAEACCKLNAHEEQAACICHKTDPNEQPCCHLSDHHQQASCLAGLPAGGTSSPHAHGSGMGPSMEQEMHAEEACHMGCIENMHQCNGEACMTCNEGCNPEGSQPSFLQIGSNEACHEHCFEDDACKGCGSLECHAGCAQPNMDDVCDLPCGNGHCELACKDACENGDMQQCQECAKINECERCFECRMAGPDGGDVSTGSDGDLTPSNGINSCEQIACGDADVCGDGPDAPHCQYCDSCGCSTSDASGEYCKSQANHHPHHDLEDQCESLCNPGGAPVTGPPSCALDCHTQCENMMDPKPCMSCAKANGCVECIKCHIGDQSLPQFMQL